MSEGCTAGMSLGNELSQGLGCPLPDVAIETKTEHPTAREPRPGWRTACVPREKQPLAANGRRTVTEEKAGGLGGTKERGSQRERGS